MSSVKGEQTPTNVRGEAADARTLGAPVRLRKNVSRTLTKFGRICDQIGRTLEPWESKQNEQTLICIETITTHKTRDN